MLCSSRADAGSIEEAEREKGRVGRCVRIRGITVRRRWASCILTVDRGILDALHPIHSVIFGMSPSSDTTTPSGADTAATPVSSILYCPNGHAVGYDGHCR